MDPLPRTARRRALSLALATVAASAVAALAPGVAAADSLLVGTVGPSAAVSLTDAAGAPVLHLDPGAYTFAVHDLSQGEDFHLYGPGGVDLSTGIPFQGDVTWTVALVAGKYYFKNDVHSENQLYAFIVGTVPPVATTTAAKPPLKKAVPKKPAPKQPSPKRPSPKQPVSR